MSTTAGLARDAVAITEDFIHHFWNGDIKSCASVLSPEFVWIGPQAKQMNLDAKGFIKTHASFILKAPHAVLANERYSFLGSPAPKIFIVTAEYNSYIEPTDTNPYAAAHRSTFVWKQTPRGHKLVHCHISHPFSSTLQENGNPAPLTQDINGHVLLLSSRRCYRSTVELRDILGNIHVLRLAEIVYLEAQKQSTIVHDTEGSFRLREGITKVVENLNQADPIALVRIHRSYVVNPLYVKTIKSDVVELATGQELPLSARRRSEAVELIAQARSEN